MLQLAEGRGFNLFTLNISLCFQALRSAAKLKHIYNTYITQHILILKTCMRSVFVTLLFSLRHNVSQLTSLSPSGHSTLSGRDGRMCHQTDVNLSNYDTAVTSITSLVHSCTIAMLIFAALNDQIRVTN